MANENKYGRITTEKGSIPEDEPVFLLRAQDVCAVPTMEAYVNECEMRGSPQSHLDGIDEAIARFEAWQRDHSVHTPTSS
ncbi:MAG: hypothetical protein ABSG46_20120 [Candidatus Binataceae bacterium]|jgi:hypothetical protein